MEGRLATCMEKTEEGRSACAILEKPWFTDDGDVEEAPMSPSAKTFFEQSRSTNKKTTPREAPPSPRANVMINQLFSSVALNTDIPPSPPVDQDRYRKHGSNPDDEISHKLRQVTKKIQVYKKKIKNFEEAFEREHGYRPSHSEKSSRPEIKKHIAELSKARKDLKKLKEEAEMGSRSRHGSGASSSGERTDPPVNIVGSIQQTLDMLMKRLEDKRTEAHRPHDLSLMAREQVQEEKLAIQKSLLHFENLYGRPTNKLEKDLMRPLYDRYRSVKRILAKPSSPRDTVELETVPEDQAIDTKSAKPSSSFHSPLKIPTAGLDEEEEEADELGTLQFAVTRDFNVLKDTINPTEIQAPNSPKVKKKISLSKTTEWKSTESNLHELGIYELHDELQRTKADKKKMRKQLREFEDLFFSEHGRKVQKEDRSPLQEEYNLYKQVKARLRLLEALIAKHNSSEA